MEIAIGVTLIAVGIAGIVGLIVSLYKDAVEIDRAEREDRRKAHDARIEKARIEATKGVYYVEPSDSIQRAKEAGRSGAEPTGEFALYSPEWFAYWQERAK